MQSPLWIAALSLGLGGSLHCLGMCGPLALALPFHQGTFPKGLKLCYYYGGKALAYGLLGMFSGLFGKGLLLVSWQQGLSVASGLLILLLAFLPATISKGPHCFNKAFTSLYHRLQHRPRHWHYPALGFLNGLLPCGLVYTAMALATASGSATRGAAVMVLFGLANAPSLILLALFRQTISQQLRRKLKPVSLVLSLAVGLLLVLRGLNLGLPYISPEFGPGQEVRSCCHKPG